jgi:methylenetetrahydrofolate--tRNA-(uracil-5-)-methyltransferase
MIAFPPATTALGALLAHITSGHVSGEDSGPRSYQPMNVNFGLFPPLTDARGGRRGRKDRYHGYTDRAKADFAAWLGPASAAA